MRELISKYEVRMLIIEEHQIQDRAITLLHSRNNRLILPKYTVPSYKTTTFNNKCYI
jgi:hypothetical protein